MKTSPENKLIWEDWKRALFNLGLFSIPWLLVFLEMLMDGMSIREAWKLSLPVLINLCIDLLKKHQQKIVYKDNGKLIG